MKPEPFCPDESKFQGVDPARCEQLLVDIRQAITRIEILRFCIVLHLLESGSWSEIKRISTQWEDEETQRKEI
jgi:hypothetical protein